MISQININSSTFSLNASNIGGKRTENILAQLMRLSATSSGQPSALVPTRAAQTGPGAMRAPAERFPEVASAAESPSPSSSGDPGGSRSANALGRGFAPGGAESSRSLDSGGMIQLVMQLLERLLEAIQSLFSGGGSQAGSGGAGSGAGSGGQGASGGCGGGGGSGPSGGTGASGGSCGSPTQGGTAPVPPRATSPPSSPPASQPVPPRDPIAQNDGHAGCGTNGAGTRNGHGGLGRLLAGLRKPRVLAGVASAASNLVLPGASLAFDAGSAISGRDRTPKPMLPSPAPGSGAPGGACGGSAPGTPGPAGGGSLEDQIFAFFTRLMQQVEGELKGAMQQQDSQGAGGGDSRSAVAQKVQQLIQKRNEMVEMLTNSLKTLHESSMAVNRNVK